MTTNQTERVSDEELDQMIWKLERDGMTPKQLSLMRELREVRRDRGEPVAVSLKLAKLFRKITNSEIDAEGNAHVILSPADSLLINNARIALASLEAEPVAFVKSGYALCYYRPPSEYGLKIGDKLYAAAQPATVVPDALADSIDSDDHPLLWSYNNGWNACRAAMLQTDGTLTNEGTMQLSGNAEQLEPVSNRDELPATQFKPVADLYGITSPTGSETSFTFDAIEAVNFIDGGWSVQEYVELERYQEAMIGNSPATPDGWKLVPEEPTHEMLEAGDAQFGTYDVYRRMIEAVSKEVG